MVCLWSRRTLISNELRDVEGMSLSFPRTLYNQASLMTKVFSGVEMASRDAPPSTRPLAARRCLNPEAMTSRSDLSSEERHTELETTPKIDDTA